MKNIKNEIFINNTIDRETGKIYKSVWVYKKTKMGKLKKDLVWQYYRDRNKQSADMVINKYRGTGHDADIIYSGDPMIYKIIL